MVFVKSKGKFRWSVKGPTAFLCNPMHQQHVVGKHIFAMASQMAKTDVTKADAQ